MLSTEQRDIALRAISRSKNCERGMWRDGGPLAQIALLTGNTEAELKHWDEVGNGDGPLTIRRIQESGNAFAGWPLGLLERLDREWRAGAERSELERIVRAESEPHTDGGEPVAAPTSYEGPERRSAFTVAVDIKTILLTATVIGPLLTVAIFLIQLRVDWRQNASDDARRENENSAFHAAQQSRIERLEASAAKFERAHSIYCSGMRRDSVRLPDADC